MTIFEKILKGDFPCSKIFENDDAIAFFDISPAAPTHALVVPKRSAETLNDLENWTDADAGKLLRAAVATAKTLNLEEDGYRVVINVGKNGGQTVAYLHLHILGGRELSWPAG